MPETPKEIFDKVESTKGKKLVLYLIPLFVLFLVVGVVIGNIMPRFLKNNEDLTKSNLEIKTEEQSAEYRGKVVYLDPNFYPNDDITFYLEDSEGKTIILLKANDQKLTVVEGLNVIVFGDVTTTKDKEEEVLMVEKIVVKN